MLKLHQFPSVPGLPNPSAPCMKVEAFLRVAGIPYETAPPDFQAAPAGRVPYVDLEGRLIGNSGVIIRHLSRTHDIDLDAPLGPRERAIALAFERMLDDHLYLAALHERWIDEHNWALVKATFFEQVPDGMRDQIADGARAGQRERLLKHGLGTHPADQIAALGQADVEALAHLLGERPYMMGDALTLLDCAAHAYVANLVIPPFAGPLAGAAKGHPNLIAYNQRMMQRVFPEAVGAAH